MAKNFQAMVLICTAALLAATVSFYLLIFGNIFSIRMQWVTLLFLILAEIIGACKLLLIRKNIFGIANITTSLIHIGSVFVASLVFVNAFPFLITTYVRLNFIFLCALVIVDAILIYSGGYIAASNAKLAESQALVGSCYEKAQSLCVEYRGGSYEKELSEIAEMIQYSDNSQLTSDELPILNSLDQLQGLLANDDPGVHEKITEIKNRIKMRSIKLASKKRGGY